MEQTEKPLLTQGGRKRPRSDEQRAKERTCGSTHLLSIDHVHGHCEGTRGCMECVRGRLCRACNTGIGMFKDSEATLEKAIAYLRRTRTARG